VSRDLKYRIAALPTPNLANVGKVVGAHEIAEMFGVSRQAVHNWLKDPDRWDFPEPLGHIKAGLVWWTADVVKWAEEKGRETHE
jgi:predicted DNA-binding transcriptional regulator AlpA